VAVTAHPPAGAAPRCHSPWALPPALRQEDTGQHCEALFSPLPLLPLPSLPPSLLHSFR
jgi:hypothetical protein